VSARDEVLGRVRQALGEGRRGVPVPRDYRGATGEQGDLELFVKRLEDYRARVVRVAASGLGEALGDALAGASSVVVPDGLPSLWLDGLPAGVAVSGELTHAELDRVDAVLTSCAVAVAETGTIVLDHGPGQGRRALSLVPDHHVVVVHAHQVVPGLPDAVALLEPTRPMTWISGPSATSDIELIRVEGVHGPRRLDVVLLEGPAATAPA
jgi:L-lactate dehydrogenase complex protein LldG